MYGGIECRLDDRKVVTQTLGHYVNKIKVDDVSREVQLDGWRVNISRNVGEAVHSLHGITLKLHGPSPRIT